ncbi:RHS repeat protein, partial [Comamonadaceae bacterium OH2545_COT-014]
ALGRLTQTTDALGGTTKQSWDAHEQLTSLTDAKGNTHSFQYDKAGQLIRETRPLGGAIQYAYDAAGQLTKRTDAAGNTRNYTYDAAQRMTLEEHKTSGSTLDQKISYQLSLSAHRPPGHAAAGDDERRKHELEGSSRSLRGGRHHPEPVNDRDEPQVPGAVL